MFKKTLLANHQNNFYLEDLSPSTNQVRFSSINVDEHALKECRVPFRDSEDACYASQLIAERMMRDRSTLFGNVFLLSKYGVESVTVIVNDKGYTIDEKGNISAFVDEGVYDAEDIYNFDEERFVVQKEVA